MSKQEIEEQLDRITQAIKGHFEGITLRQIAKLTGISESRTLQRRLKTLMEQRRLTTSGTKRGVKYYPIETQTAEKKPATVTATQIDKQVEYEIHEIPLSTKSHDILADLKIPWQQRKAVGYNRSFVDQYRPNEDFYLTEPERVRLANLTATTPGLPAGTYAKQILQRLLVDLSWNSSRLEGNTYSLLDTERLLSNGEPAPEKTAAETQMILNHKDAIEFLVRGVDEIGFNRYTLQNLHAMLANNLLPDPAAPGRLRTFGVGIKKSAYTPTAIPQLIEEMFDLVLSKAEAISNPHEQALFAMVQLPYLQPFEDVNKRVSRLAANIPLTQYNLIPISFIGVPEDLYIQGLLGVYEFNRVDLLKDIFIWACERSANRYALMRQTIGEPDPFRIKYRSILQQIVTEIITGNMSKEEATFHIKARALRIPQAEAARFIELVETELLSLHAGNFARYRISKTEFEKWQETWNK